MEFKHGLNPGDVLSNSELTYLFKVSPQGGMRRSHRTNSLLLISDHTRGSVYQDRWVGDIFHYTGMGLRGQQSLDYMQNKTLAQSESNGIDVFVFEVFKRGNYTFLGRVELAREPYEDRQPDVEGELRNVWVFPLRIMG